MIQPEELLDIKGAARLLRVSETSLRRWTNSGALPHLRIGGKRERRFRRSDLMAFLESTAVARPATRLGRQGLAEDGFFFGEAPKPGTHLCGLSSSEAVRMAQAAQFVADALRSGSICLLLTSPKARRSIVSDLKRRVPSLDTPLQAGLLIASEYAESGGAQLRYFEHQLGLAMKAGARLLYVIGDLSGGGPERATFPRLMDYEYEYERRIARRFPVVTLCQYDARRLSGLEVLAMLQAHPDALRYAGSATPT